MDTNRLKDFFYKSCFVEVLMDLLFLDETREFVDKFSNFSKEELVLVLAKLLTDKYEIGYQDGTSSGEANWIIALDDDNIPFDIHTPDDVIKGIIALKR